MAEAKDMGGAVVGTIQPFIDSKEKATGETFYLDDIVPEEVLVGRALRTPHAHALILSIDAEEAKKIPGIISIITGNDFDEEPRMTEHIKSTPLIARERVRYMGDVVALIAAETNEAADEALKKIVVKYKILKVTDNPIDGLKKNAPILFPDGNLLNHGKIRKGDLKKGFKLSDVVVEKEYRTPAIDHLYLEVESAIAMPLTEREYQIWGSTQQPFLVRQNVARILGLTGEGSVRFKQTTPGGAFGGKSEASLDVCLRAALLARASRRPVKLVYSREESMIGSTKRHPSVVRSRLGSSKDGMLMACEIEIWLDKGAYVANGGDTPPAFKRALYHSPGPYQIPNVKVDVYCVHSNNPYGGQMRGPGCPQVHFACEQQIDELSSLLDIDPIHFRTKNGLQKNTKTAWNQVLPESVGLIESLQKVASVSNWKSKKNRKQKETDGRLRGIGVASCLYGTGNAYSPAEAHVFLTSKGKIRVAAGVVDFGQGSKTVLNQIASETLDIPYDQIMMENVDTSLDPFGGTSSSSRITMQGGKAVLNASVKARDELLRLASFLLEANPEDLELFNGVVRSKSLVGKEINLQDIAKGFVSDELKLLAASDSIAPPAKIDKETGLGDPYEVYGFGSQVAEILLDSETGEIEVVGVWAAHDVGKAINPMGVLQQIEGGVYMGLGFCLMEEIIQKNGVMFNPDMHGYLAPTGLDIPDCIKGYIVEDHYSNGPYGAKGVGEQVNVPTAAAVANALFDATGKRFTILPLSPDRIVENLEG